MAAETPEAFTSLLRQSLIGDPDKRSITMKKIADTLLGSSESPAALAPIDFTRTIV